MMPIAPATFENLSSAIRMAKLPDVDPGQAQQLLLHFGIRPLQDLFALAKGRNTSACAQIKTAILAIKALDYMRACGHHGTLPPVISAIGQLGYTKVRQLMIDSVAGDQRAQAELAAFDDAPSASPATSANAQGSSTSLQTSKLPLPAAPNALDETPTAPSSGPAVRPMSSSRFSGPPRPSQCQAYRSGASRPVATAAAARRDPLAVAHPTAGNVRYLDDRRPGPPRDPEQDMSCESNAPGLQRSTLVENTTVCTRQYDQHCCYGREVAAQFERVINKSRTGNTVNLKVARARDRSSCKNGVDWTLAIVLMFEPHELQLIYAVFMGYLPNFRGAGHGHDNQKWFQVEETSGDYAGAIRVTVSNGKDTLKINIGFTDIKQVLEVFSRTLHDQSRTQSGDVMLAEIRRVANLYSLKSTNASGSRSQGPSGTGQIPHRSGRPGHR